MLCALAVEVLAWWLEVTGPIRAFEGVILVSTEEGRIYCASSGTLMMHSVVASRVFGLRAFRRWGPQRRHRQSTSFWSGPVGWNQSKENTLFGPQAAQKGEVSFAITAHAEFAGGMGLIKEGTQSGNAVFQQAELVAMAWISCC